MELDPQDLFQQRLRASFREDGDLLQAWVHAVTSAMEVRHLLEQRDWSERDQILAIDQLARAVMQTAPDGSGDIHLLREVD